MSALERISVAAIGNSVADLEAETLRAEAAGVECVWAPELLRAADTQAAYLAAKTERIGIGTGIAWAFTRSPFIHAVSALDIDEMGATAHWAHLGGFVAGMVFALGLLLTRAVNANGSDILSVALGKHAWALVGKPSARAAGPAKAPTPPANVPRAVSMNYPEQ